MEDVTYTEQPEEEVDYEDEEFQASEAAAQRHLGVLLCHVKLQMSPLIHALDDGFKMWCA